MIPFIRQVQIRNYKSIAQLMVNLEPLTILVGRNGSGKSNFIDALSFVNDCLATNIDHAFKGRGGIDAVRRISIGHPTDIEIRLLIELENDYSVDYAFKIKTERRKQFRVARERCLIKSFMGGTNEFEIIDGKFVKEIPGIKPKIETDRLALFAASAIEEFRPIYDFLTSMRFYSIVPLKLRELQKSDPGYYLEKDGSNAAAVLKRLREDPEEDKKYNRICRLLSKIVDGIKKVEYKSVGHQETVQFKQDVGADHPWTFPALNMSDGTLRVLGLLLSIYQTGHNTLIAIEEPEATVHPAVAEIIIDVLIDASKEKQILLTTHSPDILDHKHLKDNQIRVVSMQRNVTVISPISPAGKKAIRDHLYTPGELLRSGELNPDIEESEIAKKQMNLFGSPFIKN